MRFMDSTIRRCVPGLGVGRRWLKECLREQGVRTYLPEGCLQELVSDADAATWRRLSAGVAQRYLEGLRAEIAARAAFIHRWTSSDEPIDPNDEEWGPLVRIARNYALPRPWRVPEPVVARCARRVPIYWHWASRVGAASSPTEVYGAGVETCFDSSADAGINPGHRMRIDAGVSAGEA